MEENHKGTCQGASILSSMSAFQSLMDSSCFLPEKGLPATSTKEDISLNSPQEFNSKSWDSSPPDRWVYRSAVMPAWSLSPTLHGTSPQASLCPPPWTSPEHCQKQPLRSLVCAEQAEVRMFTARPPSGGWTALWLRVAREGPPGSGGHLGGPAEHVLDRWPCAPSRHTPPTLRLHRG